MFYGTLGKRDKIINKQTKIKENVCYLSFLKQTSLAIGAA
jgi:hypothetical protein